MSEREQGHQQEGTEPDESEAALARLIEQYNSYEQLDEITRRDFNVGGKLQREFLQTFRPIRVGCENAMERQRAAGGGMSQVPAPELREASSGDLLFIAAEGRTFVAVPRFGTRYTLRGHEIGGMQEMFDVIGFDDPKKEYSIRLKRPARCERDVNGRFQILEKGELELNPAS